MPVGMRATTRYWLDGQTPVPAPSREAWEDWMETSDRCVLLSERHAPAGPPVTVETCFTGWDYYTKAGEGPMFFATYVFRGPQVFAPVSCSTSYQAAVEAHALVVARELHGRAA